MGKHSRVTAIILAAALVLNMINVPVYAEQSESGSFHVETNASATLSSPSETSAQDAGITGETGSAAGETDSAASGSHNASDETGTNAGETGTGSDENEELTGTNGSSESTGSTEESDGSGSNVNTDDSSETGITGSEIETPSSGSGTTGGNANAENTGAAGETAAANDKALQSAGTFAMRTVQTASVSDTCQNFTLTDVGLSVVDNSIKIHSGADLIKLSHVAPSYYNGKILNFVSTDSSGYDTTQILDINVGSGEQAKTYSLIFAGLDFRNGTVLVASGSENFPIKLKRPLFNTLSDQVVISFGADANSSNGTGSGAGLSLMYMAKTGETLDTYIPAALLAENVVHQAANAQTEEYSELLSETEGLSESSNVSDDENASESASDVPEAASNTSETENNNIWSIRPIASDINGRMPTLIGTLEAQSAVKLSIYLPDGDGTSSFPVTLVMEAGSISDQNVGSGAGLLCAAMNSGSELTLESFYGGMPSVKAKGNAGSLVGTMNSNSSLVLSYRTFVLSDVTSINGDAGGLVGSAIDADISAKGNDQLSLSSDNKTLSSDNQKTISGINAGGLAGSFTYSGTVDESTVNNMSFSNIEINDISIIGNGSNSNGNAGGVLGILNNSGKGTIAFENSISTDVTVSANNNAGGLIGQYSASDLDGTLRLDSGNVASYLSGAATVERPSSYGGLIGWVKNGDANGAAYIEVNSAADENASETGEQTVTASDTETGSNTCTVSASGIANSFGGLIGSLSDSGHFLKVGTVSINMNSAGGSNYAGGLVGKFDSGVLWIAGDADTVLPNCGNNKNKGNYVGYRGNTLVFSSYKSGEGYSWNFNNGWNDIGNWGQVLQVSTLPGLFTVKNHKISVTGAPTGASIEVSDVLSFAQAALRFQLDAKGALEIDPDTDIDPDTTEIKLSGGSINLTGTGLTGFQRDYSSAQQVNVNITCTSNTEIKFHDTAVSKPITIYGGKGSHDRQGLFSETGDLSVVGGENAYLTLSGSISVSAIDQSVYIGSLTAESCGSVTANRVISNTSLSIASKQKEERVAGIVAHQKGGSGSAVLSVDLVGCKLGNDFSINYNGSNVCFLGGLIARIENGCRVSIENCAITGSITKTGSGECYAGGLIASLRDNETGTLGNTLTINGLTADGVTINAENATKTGGILGWEWMTDTADIQGVTVKDCTLNAGSARFGGLVYKGNGYWSVHGSGIKFIQGDSGNSFTGGSSDSGVSGLFLADGTKGKDHKNALYLEIQSGAYTIEDSNTIEDSSITLVLNDGNSSSKVFDEIIGTTEDTDASDGSGNGIVSIGTGFEGSPQASDCSYTKEFSDYHNSKTRYYYNLDVFRSEAAGSGGSSSPAAASGDIDSSGKMVLYSAYTHCYSGIKKYFYSNPGKITGTLDLTGYSYYPAEIDTTIENAAVTFDYKGLEDNVIVNKNAIKPSDINDQNYGMHTGIYTEVTVASDAVAPKTLNVSSLTLSGTVGNYNPDGSGTAGISGALIRGDAHGGNTNAKLNLEITGVTLSNLLIYPRIDTSSEGAADAAVPLLINSIGAYTNLNISGVEMKSYTYGTGASDNLIIGSGYYAATSLIGNTGSENASHIQLVFSDMVLDGTPSKTIFSHGLFLESFMYSGDSSGVYNFNNCNDKRYTLGRELSNTDRTGETAGPSGRNNGLQYHFFDDDKNVCTVVAGVDTADPENFFNDYTRYVYRHEGGQSYWHELDINLSRTGLIQGCGSINDPYIIGSSIQLSELANILSTDTALKGMQIQVDTGVLSGTSLNGFKSSHDAGDISKHIIYTGDTNWKDTGSGSVSAADMKLYLRNAYYRLEKNIEISGEWTGLGASADSAFCGVIDGNGNTITIKSASSSQFGGVIKFSMGSVVKNLTVHYASTPAVTSDGIPSDTSKASFFGGIVGWCIGGDTILQDVSVTGLSVPDISGTYPNLASVGGYVGMVGGALINNTLDYGGGVVFRGTVGAGLSGGKASSDSNYFYVNPYVGRVMDGYAMSETAVLDNTDKNYSIPVIYAGKHINRTDNVITVNDAQGLWLLSAIANSGAGAVQNSSCKAYTYGKTRTGNYSAIDDAARNVDESYIGGKQYTNKEVSYLSRYAEGNINTVCKANSISISLAADCNMTTFGNGFRGVGTGYGTNANTNINYRLLKITSVGSSAAGTSRTITLNQNKNEYLEEKDSWTAIGTGMFVLMGVPSGGSLTVSDLTFKGETGIVYYKFDSIGKAVKKISVSDLNYSKLKTDASNGSRLTLVGAGMLTGSFAKTGTISKVTCSNVHVSGTESSKVYINKDSQGTTFAGGLIGALWNNGTITAAEFKNCSVKNAEVVGRLDTGGMIGYLKSGTATISAETNDPSASNAYTVLQNVSVTAKQIKKIVVTGVGGLIGNSDNCTLNIGNANNQLVLLDFSISSEHKHSNNDSNVNDIFNAGGLVGVWIADDKDAGSVVNVSMQGSVAISAAQNDGAVSNVGGITGALSDSTSAWGGSTKKTHLELTNIRIATEENSSMSISNGRQIGGLIGLVKARILNGKSEVVKLNDIRIGYALESAGSYNVKLISNSNKIDCSVGGLIGTVCIDPIIVMKNIELNGIAAMTHGESSSSAALLIAFTECHTGTAKFKFSNVTVNKCAAVGDHDNVNAAMIVGRFVNNKHEVTGNNILFNECKVGLSLTYNGTKYVLKKLNNSASLPELETVGIKVGSGNSSEYKPYDSNISVADIEKIGNNNIGSLFGLINTNRMIQIAGISVQNCLVPLRDYGTNSANSASYIIYADYEGDSLNARATGSESFFTAGQYVTTRPESNLVILKTAASNDKPEEFTITGDGAAFSSETGQETESVLKKILDDSDGRYYNIQDKSKAFLTAKTANNTVALSTFKNSDLNTFETVAEGASAGSVSGPSDFPVVVLQTNSSSVANSCLYSIISVLTNKELCTDTKGAVTSGTLGFDSITATSYKWSDTKQAFEAQVKESGSYPNPSLNVSGNTFYLKPGGYDNKLKQFTLVDVAYKDPENPSGTENVYHLYIPVVIKKMFDFKFWASAKLGTDYNVKNQYDELSAPVIASHGENVTALLTYEYQWSVSEWEDAMKNGQNLLWNFDLGVVFDPYSLPSGTKMTLIDRNHGDRAYFFESTKDVNSVSFNDFRTVLGDGTGWKEGRYLCDDLKLTASGPKDSGAYCRLVSDKSEATLRDIEGYYYRPAQSTDSTDSRYDLNITRDNGSSSDGDDNDYKVTARFFLTLQTPASDSGGIVNTNIQCSDILQGNLPTRRLPAEEQTGTGEQKREFSKNGSENKVIIGDFFTQETTVTTTRGEEKMTETNEDIPLELTTAISFKDATAEENYRAYASNQRLYQKFVIRLHEYKNGSSGQKDLAQGTFIRVQHYLGDKPLGDPVTEMLTSSEPYYTIEYRWTDGEPGIPAGSVANGMRLKTNVTLTYLPAVRTEQFPIRSSESSNDGIAVAASSSIAYNLDSLRNGHNSSVDTEAACGQMVPHFYREDTGTASLYYAAYEDTDTVPAESVSRLGINGKDGTEFEIDSMAIYNVSNVKEAVDADKLEVTVTLLQKQSGSTYDSLIYTDITELEALNTFPDYLSETAADPGVLFDVKASYRPKGQGSMQQAALSESGINTFSFNLSGIDPTVPIQIPVKLNVKTGDGFSGIYANYRVRVTAQLKNGDTEIGNSVATDYIVYTNAMISRSFIDIPAESDGGNGTQ